MRTAAHRIIAQRSLGRLAHRRGRLPYYFLQQAHLLSSSSNEAVVVPSCSSNNDTTTPAIPLIDFQVAASIEGEESHVAFVELQPGETLRAESASMVFMTDSIEMNTTLAGTSKAFSRFLTGQNLFLTDFAAVDKPGTVCLGTEFPSKILRFHLDDHNGSLICQRGAYLASNPNVDIQMEFTKSLSAGFFGGQGFILQRLEGPGDVLLKGGGTIVHKELRDNETLRVTSGSIVAFESSIAYDVQMMKGIQNVMFGGEGLFVTTLTGPGQVWLQGMPPDRMIAEIARRVPGPGIGLGVPIGMGGGGGGAAEEGATGAEAGPAAGAAEEASSGEEEMVAATDAAVDADRQATVASSGMQGDEEGIIDSDSPSALFGDAAPDNISKAEAAGESDETSFATSTTEPTFMEDDLLSSSTMSGDEPTFDDDDSTFSTGDFTESSEQDFKDGELFDDSSTTTTDIGSSDAAEEGGSGLLGTLWDLFMGGDD